MSSTPSQSAATPAPPAWQLADWIFLALLVVFFPLAIASHFYFGGTFTFIAAALALVPLARIMGQATEVIAHRVSPGIGGLLNASFGNAAELIIALAALRSGQLAVVKASITGSVLCNLLLVLGAAMLAGGVKREKQSFNSTAALSGAAMMFLALVAMIIPHLLFLAECPPVAHVMEPLSVGIAGVLLVMYALSLFFSLRTHSHLYAGEESEEGADHGLPHWSTGKSVAFLCASTVGVVIMAEFLVHAIEDAIKSFGFTHTFVGVVVIAIVGNAAEHSTAVLMAMKNKMDLAFNVALESSKQIALFVAPVLVLVGLFIGQQFTLEFTNMEVIAMTVGIGSATLVALDGESNWLEGTMLIAVYAILSMTFYFVP